MSQSFNLKSAVIGITAGVIAMFAIGAAEKGESQIGRFQIQTCPGQPNGFIVVLDTTSGKVWMGNGSGPQLRSDPDFFQAKDR